MSYTPEDRISRKNAAALARKSEDTIRRAERKHRLSTQIDPDTKEVTYRVGDLVDLGLIRITDLAFAGSAQESAEVIKARRTITDLEIRVAERDAELRNYRFVIDTLTEQLRTKDKQIADQSKVIIRLGGAA